MARRQPSGALEREVLRRLRRAPEGMPGRDVWQAFVREPAAHGDGVPARTTILTVLGRLEAKGLVVRDGSHDPAVFRASMGEEEAIAEQMAALLRRAADRHAVLTQFAGGLTAADVSALQASIRAES